MRTVKHFLHCDGPGCNGADPAEGDGPDELARNSVGWRRRRDPVTKQMLDLCPDCLVEHDEARQGAKGGA